jgi:hypothetical protein
VTLKITRYIQSDTVSKPCHCEYHISFNVDSIPIAAVNHYFNPGYDKHQESSSSVFPILPSLAYIPTTNNYLLCLGQSASYHGYTCQVTEIKTNTTLPEDFDYKNMIITGTLPMGYVQSSLTLYYEGFVRRLTGSPFGIISSITPSSIDMFYGTTWTQGPQIGTSGYFLWYRQSGEEPSPEELPDEELPDEELPDEEPPMLPS